jgi:hypothetical protein
LPKSESFWKMSRRKERNSMISSIFFQNSVIKKVFLPLVPNVCKMLSQLFALWPSPIILHHSQVNFLSLPFIQKAEPIFEDRTHQFKKLYSTFEQVHPAKDTSFAQGICRYIGKLFDHIFM